MKNYEDYVLGKIKALLPGTFHISTPLSLLEGMRPDAIIYYKKIAIAVVEIKKQLANDSILRARYQLNQYARQYGINLMVVCSDDTAIRLYEDMPLRDERMTIDAFITNLIIPFAKESELTKDDANSLKKGLIEATKGVDLENTSLPFFLNSLTSEDLIRETIVTSGGELIFNDSFETKLFKSLIRVFSDSRVCRYTSLSSTIRILKEEKASVCGIACMNDKSECYYVDQYLMGSNTEQLLSDMSESEIRELNQYFIMSCSDVSRLDKLTMWRMYGSGAEGCCFTYRLDETMIDGLNFYLAPISYAKEDGTHPELDFIKKLVNEKFIGRRIVLQSLNLWKHFFKPYDYADECEVRLLYKESDSKRYKWISTGESILCPIVEFSINKNDNKFPLKIDSVMLGPKCPEKYTNVAQLSYFTSLQDIASVDGTIHFNISNIDNYR